jgi:RHS repeat-associated protein
MMQLKTSLSQSLESDTFSLGPDANGNITEYLDQNGITVAYFEYSPFGQLTLVSGSEAGYLNIRYSSKYWDLETNLGYWNHRYYEAEQGRFISCDPIEESGGLMLYGYCGNEPVGRRDLLGMACCADKEYAPEAQCCCDGKVESKTEQKTGIIKRCVKDWTGIITGHCWMQEGKWSAGFYMSFKNGEIPLPYGKPGTVFSPDVGYEGRTDGTSEEMTVNACPCELDKIKECVKDVARKHANNDWLPPNYSLGIFDCRHYPGYVLGGCKKLIDEYGEYPPPDTLSRGR